jgi:hypothetical protein
MLGNIFFMETLQILVLVNISIYKINLRVTVRDVQSEFTCSIFPIFPVETVADPYSKIQKGRFNGKIPV